MTLRMSTQFSGDSKPCQPWNGPYVECNVMTHKTIGVKHKEASTLFRRVEEGWQGRLESRSFSKGGILSPLHQIPFHRLKFMPAPLVESSQICKVQPWVAAFSTCLHLKKRTKKKFRTKTKRHLVSLRDVNRWKGVWNCEKCHTFRQTWWFVTVGFSSSPNGKACFKFSFTSL